jgi:uncharacterized lipoprotein
VEWWYWLETQQHNPTLWDQAKKIVQENQL